MSQDDTLCKGCLNLGVVRSRDRAILRFFCGHPLRKARACFRNDYSTTLLKPFKDECMDFEAGELPPDVVVPAEKLRRDGEDPNSDSYRERVRDVATSQEVEDGDMS